MLKVFRDWVRLGASKDVGATLEMARAHVVVVNGASEAAAVVDVPESHVVELPSDQDNGMTLRSIPGIERATFSLGAVPRISAVLQSTPFRVRSVDPQRSIDARVDKLPHELDLSLDLGNGIVDYDGHGSAIDRITVAVALVWFTCVVGLGVLERFA
jgi:hypothetical protein